MHANSNTSIPKRQAAILQVDLGNQSLSTLWLHDLQHMASNTKVLICLKLVGGGQILEDFSYDVFMEQSTIGEHHFYSYSIS